MSKILIIEDNMGEAKLLANLLSQNGFSPTIAQDGLQGTTLAHSEKPDLIILDLILPVGGGLQILRNLKVSVHTERIPVIVLTGTEDENLKSEVEGIGVRELIEKPYNPEDMITRIQAILSK